MTSATAFRISLLFGPSREVYRVFHATAGASVLRTCVRCGGAVTDRGVRARRPLFFVVRDRGTEWRNREYGAIHAGCVPVGHEVLRIGARSLRSSQVRA